MRYAVYGPFKIRYAVFGHFQIRYEVSGAPIPPGITKLYIADWGASEILSFRLFWFSKGHILEIL